MLLEAISSAATIALACAVLALLLVKTARFAVLPLSRSSRFANSIMIEAAQRFRDQLQHLSGERSVYVTGILVFAATFLVAWILDPQEIFAAVPAWKHGVLLFVVIFAFACLLYRMWSVALEARRLEFERDANLATGHSLLKLTGNNNRVFHDVPCESGYIDHVVVGLQGIYAVKVIAKRPLKDNRVRLKDDQIAFAPGREWQPLSDFGVAIRQLAVQFRKQVGHEVNIRKVIAVPGWEVDVQHSDEYLLVNEQNLIMMSGWKDSSDYLLNEDVELIQGFLTQVSQRGRV
ncbi:MAG: hypothetical protein KJO82_05565 [Gammaproteobacteria bacterium]|nr:hypothetical protein [Gammaproteobacteria bacterium]